MFQQEDSAPADHSGAKFTEFAPEKNIFRFEVQKLFDRVCKGKLSQFVDALDDIGYCPFTIDELTTTVTENWNVYGRYQSFFFWENEVLKKRYRKNRKS